MNDRAVGILDKYEIEVVRTKKGRSAILCETKQGLKIIKEYKGTKEKAALQNTLLMHIRQEENVDVEIILPNKEGELLTKDTDESVYVLKDYFDGRECNMKEQSECERVMTTLARLHKAMCIPQTERGEIQTVYSLEQEFEKHNKELRKIRKFIRSKGQKTDFEIYLLRHFDTFMEKALFVTEEIKRQDFSAYYEKIQQKGTFCHGDYQYHNVLFDGDNTAVINFEKCILDSNVRDMSLFMRKLLEKNNWSEEIGYGLLLAYDKEKTLEDAERRQLYFRLAYPEKFWKIVNFYYNSAKAWIPGRNMEKLEALLAKEVQKEHFLSGILKYN